MSSCIIWDGTPLETLSDADEILQRLQRIAAERSRSGVPYGLDLLRDVAQFDDPSQVPRLSIGIGDGEWVVFYYPGDGTFVNSLGDEHAVGTITFDFGEWSEMSRKYLIPKDAALQAIRTWVATGKLDDAVKWTTKLY